MTRRSSNVRLRRDVRAHARELTGTLALNRQVDGYFGMPEQPEPNKAEKRENRKAVRQGEKIRHRALMEAMRALWAGQDADCFNLLDEAKEAHPGPDGTIFALFGATSKLINRLAELTGEDREEILRRVLDPPFPRR